MKLLARHFQKEITQLYSCRICLFSFHFIYVVEFNRNIFTADFTMLLKFPWKSSFKCQNIEDFYVFLFFFNSLKTLKITFNFKKKLFVVGILYSLLLLFWKYTTIFSVLQLSFGASSTQIQQISPPKVLSPNKALFNNIVSSISQYANSPRLDFQRIKHKTEWIKTIVSVMANERAAL